MTTRLVTSALPYANGPIHLGHMVEHVQTDVYVRYLRSIGDQVTWICAADAHGTPIEVNAGKAGMAPADFAEKHRAGHLATFARFGIGHDTYYTTHSPENRAWAYRIYDALKAKGLIYKKSVEQLYCEHDQRFLPDRFVKGTCPKCGTADQYGDVCESCGTTYDPRELKAPYCALCRSAPVLRESEHAYVNLRKPEVARLIQEWVEADGHLEPAVRQQVKGWLADLQDWCISRDAPYFGFPVQDPDFPGKFLYVWMDAPIGYLSSGEHHFAAEVPPAARLTPAQYEAKYLAPGTPSRLEHFIGKDILRFHAVFWPAMLWAAGLKRPNRMAVHGFLTVNGEKMSKSRGTFINADAYLETGLDPELLRYFLAANLGPGVGDLDLSLEEFRNRVNADLANNVANLASRVAALAECAGGESFERPAGGDVSMPAGNAARLGPCTRLLRPTPVPRGGRATSIDVANVCNRRVQEGSPGRTRPGAAEQAVLYDVGKALIGARRGAPAHHAEVLPPRWPDAFGQSLPPWDRDSIRSTAPAQVTGEAAADRPPRPEAGGEAHRRAGRGREALQGGQGRQPGPGGRQGEREAGARPGHLRRHPVRGLRQGGAAGRRRAGRGAGGEGRQAAQLSVDVGEPEPRTIVAGIAQAYPEPSALVGKRIVVVANLAPRPLRGITSQGMLLAAGEPPHLQVVTVGDAIAPGTRVK